MVWTTYTTEEMESLSRWLFKPLMLMVNYTLLLYLLVFYWARRNKRRVRALFTVGALGVACLIPFADSRDHVVTHLNDLSEACCAITFLLQITIIGYNLNKKIKSKTVIALTYMTEVLIVEDVAVVVLSLVDVIHGDFFAEDLDVILPNVSENMTLLFIFVFRYYYIVISLGWRDVWANRKLEVGCYLLYATHEVPFAVLEDLSGLPWECVQALWNRVMLAGCLWITARTKLHTSSMASTASFAYRTPSMQAQSAATPNRAGKANAYAVGAKRMKQPTEHNLAGELKPRIAVANE